MRYSFTLLLISGCLLVGSCSQIQDKLTALRVKGTYQSKDNIMEITDKKVILSDADTAIHIKMLFNYEIVGKRLVLEPSNLGGLGGLVMAFGAVPEIQVINADSVRYIVNSRNDIYKRVAN